MDNSGRNSPVLEDLMARAKILLQELEVFKDRLQTLRQVGNVELGHFRGTLQSELNMLQRLSNKPESETTNHVARSSNLPFLEMVWNTAKKSKDVSALQKRIYTSPGVRSMSQGLRHVRIGPEQRTNGLRDGAVIVDAITDAGRVWVKVSLVTNSRLLFDLAKQGWDSGSDHDDEDIKPLDPDDDTDVPLLKSAKELTRAASAFRVRTKIPTVHLVLPRIVRGETAEVDAVLKSCEATGAVLICGPDLSPIPTIDTAIQVMVPDPIASFSDILNIDCTILLAIVSEFSHAKVAKAPWFHGALNRQVEIEDNENLLPSLLYPALGNHEMVCTEEAAKRMREIVDTIGTRSEKARTRILLGIEGSKTQSELVREMQEWSAYKVPEDLQLPIRVVPQDEGGRQASLPSVAHTVSSSMTAINKSVFLSGWATGRTTITSNRTVVKQMEHDLEAFEDLDDSCWPKIWLCPTARSLVGKEKRGTKREAMRLPDPLHREGHRRHGLDVLSIASGHEVEDRRPNGYPCDEVLAAKNASQR